MLPLLAGALLGLGKSELVDRPQEARDRKTQAEIARWSPWGGMKADMGQIKPASPFNSALQGGLTGATLGQQGAFGAEDAAAPEVAGGQVPMSQMAPTDTYTQSMMQKYPWAR